MSVCASGILMGSLTAALLLSDLLYSREDRFIPHLFLGGITTSLFFLLCQNGYEMVNWSIILIIPVYAFLSWIVDGSRPIVNTIENDIKRGLSVPNRCCQTQKPHPKHCRCDCHNCPFRSRCTANCQS
jgi:hypothetical protein